VDAARRAVAEVVCAGQPDRGLANGQCHPSFHLQAIGVASVTLADVSIVVPVLHLQPACHRTEKKHEILDSLAKTCGKSTSFRTVSGRQSGWPAGCNERCAEIRRIWCS